MSHRLALLACLIYLALLSAQPAWSDPPKDSVRQRTDNYGDLLPPGAVARMGSVLYFHGLAATRLAFSPDGKILAVSGGGGSGFNSIARFVAFNYIRLLDVATGRQLHQLQGHSQTHSLRFSPDGKSLVSKGRDGGSGDSIKIWDVATGKELHRLKGQTLTRDGQTLIAAAAENDRVIIRFVSIATGKELHRITIPHQGVSELVSAPDDKKLAGQVRGDHSICIWDAATGKELHRMAGRENYGVNWLAFSPTGEMLAAQFGDGGTVKLWDVASGKELHHWRRLSKFGHVIPAFSPDDKTLAVGGAEKTMQLCDARTGKETGRIKVPESSVLGSAFSPDGKTLAWGSQGDSWNGYAVHLWDLVEKKERHPPGRLPSPIEAIAFLPDGKTLLTSGRMDEPVREWETVTGKELRQFKRPEGFNPPIFSSSGRLVAVMGKKPQLFSVTTGKQVVLRGQLPEYTPSVTFSPDERLLAIGAEKSIRLFDTATGEERRALGTLRGSPWRIAFTADGKTLLGRLDDEDDSSIKVWDVATGKLLRNVQSSLLRMHPEYLAFSPDGRLVAGIVAKWDREGVILQDMRVLLGDLTTGEEIRELRTDLSVVYCLTFSPDGRSLACVYETGGVIRLWEVATGQQRRQFEGHRQGVHCLAFSADGSLLATGAEDHTALVWDLTGRLENGLPGRSELSAEQLRMLWADLAAKDADSAYRAICRLLAGRQTVAFLRERLRPVAALDAQQRKQVTQWIADLDSPRFDTREKAARELERQGELAESALRAALADKPSLEMRRRARPILESLDLARSQQRLQALRAVEVLERCATSEAREFLKEIAKGAPDARLTQEAKAALERWERRSALAADK